MGLDISHDAFHGAYSAFNRFRRFVLQSIGGSFPPHEDKSLDKDSWYWETDFSDPKDYPGLCEFLSHSDCDGEINPETCKVIAEEFESILPYIEKLAETEPCHGHLLGNGGYVEVVKQFIKGCKKAYENNEPLEFR